MPAKTEPISLDQSMSGILALLAAARDDAIASDPGNFTRRKTEVVLANSGLTPTQIGQLLGKKPKIVSQIIIRARGKAGNGVNNA